MQDINRVSKYFEIIFQKAPTPEKFFRELRHIASPILNELRFTKGAMLIRMMSALIALLYVIAAAGTAYAIDDIDSSGLKVTANEANKPEIFAQLVLIESVDAAAFSPDGC